MKKVITLFLISCLTVLSCKNEQKTEKADSTETQNDGTEVLKGHFVLYDGAAVLQTENKIYGVLLTDKAYELDNLAKKHKSEPTDMVRVEIKGKVTTKSHDKIRWPNKLEITEILNVWPEQG